MHVYLGTNKSSDYIIIYTGVVVDQHPAAPPRHGERTKSIIKKVKLTMMLGNILTMSDAVTGWIRGLD